MMNDEQYYKYIQKMVKESLDVQYDNISNESELNRENKNTIATLIANPFLLNDIVCNLKNWSYEQAEKNNFKKNPRMASFFLSHIVVRNYAMQYVNFLTQGKKQVQGNQLTR